MFSGIPVLAVAEQQKQIQILQHPTHSKNHVQWPSTTCQLRYKEYSMAVRTVKVVIRRGKEDWTMTSLLVQVDLLVETLSIEETRKQRRRRMIHAETHVSVVASSSCSQMPITNHNTLPLHLLRPWWGAVWRPLFRRTVILFVASSVDTTFVHVVVGTADTIVIVVGIPPFAIMNWKS
jgi:hypothetical protein